MTRRRDILLALFHERRVRAATYIVGLVLVSAGAWMIYQPSALMVFGCGLIMDAVRRSP